MYYPLFDIFITIIESKSAFFLVLVKSRFRDAIPTTSSYQNILFNGQIQPGMVDVSQFFSNLVTRKLELFFPDGIERNFSAPKVEIGRSNKSSHKQVCYKNAGIFP